jgi:hypothetical protein
MKLKVILDTITTNTNMVNTVNNGHTATPDNVTTHIPMRKKKVTNVETSICYKQGGKFSRHFFEKKISAKIFHSGIHLLLEPDLRAIRKHIEWDAAVKHRMKHKMKQRTEENREEAARVAAGGVAAGGVAAGGERSPSSYSPRLSQFGSLQDYKGEDWEAHQNTRKHLDRAVSNLAKVMKELVKVEGEIGTRHNNTNRHNNNY